MSQDISHIVSIAERWNLTSKQIIGLTILLAVASVLYGGWALSVLWGWFMVPFGVPPINATWGVGLHCLGALFTFRRGMAEIVHDDSVPAADLRRLGVVASVFDYTFFLLIGAAAHAFM